MQSASLSDEAPRIVVVEDDDVLTVLLRYNLEYSGFAVDVVPDGIEALRKLVARPPQLVILDWNVPRLSGIEILRYLRRQIGMQLPVVMLTARTDVEDRRRALALGVDVYIEKPFVVQELVAVVSRLITRDCEQTLEPDSIADRHRGCIRAG